MTLHRARWADLDPFTLHDIIRLRVDVFVVEQACPYPEIDGRDVEPATEHVWEADVRGVASYLRVLAEPDGARRVGRVVTRPDVRGSGVAARLLADVVLRHGHGPLVLDAQSYLARFYERFGFVATGREFLEDGIPHIPMRRAASGSLTNGGAAQGVTTQGSDATSSPSSTFGPV